MFCMYAGMPEWPITTLLIVSIQVGAADQAPETAAMSKTAEPVIKARQVSPMEEVCDFARQESMTQSRLL